MNLYREPNGQYAIRGPEADRHQWVEFWSARRLSFDNKRDAEKRPVSNLPERLQLLRNIARDPPNQWLPAVFASDDPIHRDAGNLTYLNVGTRAFAGLAATRATSAASSDRWRW